MNISIIGTGYVGLVAGACFAELGNKVICVDNNRQKIELLQKGGIPIFEPGLEGLVQKNTKAKRLSFSADLKAAVKASDVVFIAVGTPPKPNGDADLSYVEGVAHEIAAAIVKYTVVVEKSTVPVETGDKVALTINNAGVDHKLFDVVSNPEFLREGSAIEDFMNPDRIVIGTNSEKARSIMEKLYSPLKAEMVFTDIRSAEIIKHASNSFLAAKISFINAVSRICELSGADVEKVAVGMGLDKRIGKQFLRAGLGYGGSCFPKDVDAFIKIAGKQGYDFKLLKVVQEINKEQRMHFTRKVEEALWNLNGKRIGVLGLSFKPDTDDMREAPSVEIIAALQKEGVKIAVYDPVAEEKAIELIKGVELKKDAIDVFEDAAAVLVLTEWPQFRNIDFKKAKSMMKAPLIIDGRNLFSKEEMIGMGFKYISMGR